MDLTLMIENSRAETGDEATQGTARAEPAPTDRHLSSGYQMDRTTRFLEALDRS